jgi:hypothetical protein
MSLTSMLPTLVAAKATFALNIAFDFKAAGK